MSNFTLDQNLKTVAEVAKDLSLSERRIQQMIEAGDLMARKAIDLEELALRKAARIGRPTGKGVWLIHQEAVQHLQQLRTVPLEGTHRAKVGYPEHRPRSKQSKLPAPSQASESALKEEPFWKVPTALTPLIGREQDVATVCALLASPEVRLLTLLGTGGIGKTRLSLQVALQVRERFVDGVCFVPLASISDATLFLLTIAQKLNIQEMGMQPIFEQMKLSLREKRFLLLLDNFEQIMTAAPLVEELLTACPQLKIVVTSHSVLHVQGEHQYSVPPLALPNLTELPDRETLAQIEAVALFIQRAKTILHTFELTDTNAYAIGEICVRLDGLPLAIELAAARVKLLSPQTLLSRLTQPLAVLTGGIRTGPVRQQTLRNTLKWSYDLLDSEEQRLFRRLSVFVGGWTLEAVEAVMKLGKKAGSDTSSSVLDGVAALLDKSFLYRIERNGEEPRLIMLQTVREYGLERLMESGEMETIRHAHASSYLELAEAAERESVGPRQVGWLELLEREYDNLRAAMQWLVEGIEDGYSIEMALRLGGALERFWIVRGHWSEGRHFLDRALARSKGMPAPIRARALETVAQLALSQGEHVVAKSLTEESLALYTELGDARGVAKSLYGLGLIALTSSDFLAARSLLEESLTLYKEIRDKQYIAYLLTLLAYAASELSEYTRACALLEESLAMGREMDDKGCVVQALGLLAQVIVLSQSDSTTVHLLINECLALSRELGDKNKIANCFFLSALVALREGDFTTAHSLLEKTLILHRELGDRLNVAETLAVLARIEAHEGKYATADALCEESLTLAKEVGDKTLIAFSLEGMASVLAARGEPTLAAQLWGTGESLRETIGAPIPPFWRSDYSSSVALARGQLGERDFAVAWAEGRTLTPEQALAVQDQATMALHIPSRRPPTPLVKSPSTYPNDLTAREVEVLRLVAQGWADTQISEHLVISPRTVNTHLTSIFRKIEVTSRSAATRYAFEHKLV